jgi:hypothetical protein
MKSLFFFLTFCFALSTQLSAQVPPQAFNYSAVARNAAGQPIATTTIGVQISILKGSSTGQVQYSENHFVNTDAYGLFNLVIGSGAVQSGSMAAITWSNDDYYLKVGMDANGGTNFITMGTTQLLSVPYAQHAKTAESLVGGGNGGAGNFTHYIGEEFGGGVIFHLWKDAQGVEHGLIVDKMSLSFGAAWSNVDQDSIGNTATSLNDGLSNSTAIVGQPGHTTSAAALCLNSTNGGQSDWYLPSIDELTLLLWYNRFNVERALSNIQGASEISVGAYWSSTERDLNAFYHSFPNCNYCLTAKSSALYVRAIRAF